MSLNREAAQMATSKVKSKKSKVVSRVLFAFLLFTFAFIFSCAIKPTDMRSLVPADTLVYLETNDLAAALQPIVDNKPFAEVAKSKPDFASLRGVQVAVAVTGFETSEEKLTDEHSVGRVQPHFVAVADTHAWNFQAVGFAEKKLGSFVAEIYDSDPTVEKLDKDGGKYFIWTAPGNEGGGRTAYALVIGSLIYFGNDETAIQKCLAVKRGESDSITKTGKLQSASQGTLASGYVSTEGVAQIANIVALKFASQAGDEPEIQSGIAGILPQLLRGTITDITWSASLTDEGIEDKYQIGMPPDVASVFYEAIAANDHSDTSFFRWIPADAQTATLYNFKNSLVAWRSVILMAQKQTGPLAGKAVAEFAKIIFEPYGVSDGEKFFDSVSPHFITANLSADGDKPIVVAVAIDPGKIGEALSADLKLSKGKVNYDKINKSPDGDLEAFFDDDFFVGGEAECVDRIFHNRPHGPESGLNGTLKHRFDGNSVAMTVGHDKESAEKIAELLSEKKTSEAGAESTYYIETRFTKSGMERRTVSDFGLIGSIITQLGGDR